MGIINQIFDAVFYGTDLEFKYNNAYYFINSGKENVQNEERHTISVTKSTSSFYEGENDENILEIYNSYNVDSSNNTDKFFNAKIFEGKSLYEIIDNITDVNY